MQPRAKSSEAESRQLLLQKIAEKRSQQQQQVRPTPVAPQFEYKDLEDSPSEDDLEDSSCSETENRPPSPPTASKPGLSRLRPNLLPMSALDDMVSSVQKLSLAKRETTNSSGRSSMPLNSRPALCLANAELAAAAACKLPLDSADEGQSSSEQDATSEDGEEEESEEEEDDYSDSDEGSEQENEDGGAPLAGLASTASTGQDAAAGAGDLLLAGKTPQEQFVLPATLYSKLYPHQVEGVRWLWSLQVQQRGGILGDDMGLGKTMQCSAFVAGLLHSKLIRRALVVAPKTLLLHWEKELAVCGLGRRTHSFVGDSAPERDAALRAVGGSTGGVLLTTYGMILHNAGKLSAPQSSSLRRATEDFKWDLVILDEGHKVKNPKMKLVQELRRLPAGITIIISGTPIQNNLGELHALFDLCCEGLLGDRRAFKSVYERHITAGQDRGATARQRDVGAAVAGQLRNVIAPFFLRREKKDVLCGPSSSSGASSSTQTGPAVETGASETGRESSGQARPLTLSHKNDLVVWLRLQPLQRSVYTSFLHSDAVKGALNETDSALAALTVLKKICDHPALLSEAAAKSVIAGGNRWAKHGQAKGKARRSSYSSDSSDASDDTSAGASTGLGNPAAAMAEVLPALGGDVRRQLVAEMHDNGASSSCKTVFVLKLLDELAAKGHRTLIFSQSRIMLDILQAAVVARKMAFCRIDGNVVSAEERQAQVKRFQREGADIPVFLLTSQVGGLGLTLTAADRVVIVDPSWNPAVDNQAVDRAYRIGQTRDVVVYRLITCGTVEEKMYRKQVFKGGLSRTGTEEGVQFRYFTQQQLRDLFTVSEEGLEHSATQQQLHTLHAAQRRTTEELNQHLEFLKTMQGFAGISDHDLLFSACASEPHQSMSAAEGAVLVGALEAAAAREGRPAERRKPTGGPGAVGDRAAWRGDSDLSTMFSASLSLGPGPEAQAARVQRAAQQRRVDELQKRLDSTTATISGLAARMGDGGGKLLRQREALQAELDLELAKLHSLSLETGPSQQEVAGPSSSSQSHAASTALPTDPAPQQDAVPAWRQFRQPSTQVAQAQAPAKDHLGPTDGPAAALPTATAPQQWGKQGAQGVAEQELPLWAAQDTDTNTQSGTQQLGSRSTNAPSGQSSQHTAAATAHTKPAAATAISLDFPDTPVAAGGGVIAATPASSEAASTGGSEQRGLRLAYGARRRAAAAAPAAPAAAVSAAGGSGVRGTAPDDTVSLVSGSFLTADSQGTGDSGSDDDVEVTSGVAANGNAVAVGDRGAVQTAQGSTVGDRKVREKAPGCKQQPAVIDLTSD